MRRPLPRALAFAASFAAAVPALTACSNIESEDIDTDAITADITVRVRKDGSASDVTATLSAGAFTFIDLGSGDRLVARADETTAELQEKNVLGAISYEGALAGVAAAGTEVTVAFERTTFASAPGSSVDLPAPVAIGGPAAGTSFSRANDDIVVTLTPDSSVDGVRVSWSGDCIEADSFDVPAGQTELKIDKGIIQKAEPADDNAQPVADSCPMKLTVERAIVGVLDGGFEAGSIRAVTSDSRDLTTNP